MAPMHELMAKNANETIAIVRSSFTGRLAENEIGERGDSTLQQFGCL
jgi:hypothetical protein